MKILVVDDEGICRITLQKLMSQIGECIAVDNGKEALSVFSTSLEKKEPFDIITLDISMPFISGDELLIEIRKNEKKNKIPPAEKSKIIMVTSRMNRSTIKSCIKSGCNAYISKPVTPQQLLYHLEKLGVDLPADIKEKNKGKNEKIAADVVTEIINRFNTDKIELPVLPHIVQEVQTLLEGSDPSIDDLAKIVEKDAVMSAKLISIANSPLYKGSNIVTGVNAALLRLGMKETQTAISTVANKNLYASDKDSSKDLLKKLWMHSFACAAFGKLIAEELKAENPETVFLMGIIHDIGKLLLIKAVEDISPDESFEKQELQIAIQEIHTSFGAALIKKLGFSEDFIIITDRHHWTTFPEKTAKELLIINLADSLANKSGYDFFNFDDTDSQNENDGESDEKGTEDKDKSSGLEGLDSLKQLNIDMDKLSEIEEKAKEIIQESANMF